MTTAQARRPSAPPFRAASPTLTAVAGAVLVLASAAAQAQQAAATVTITGIRSAIESAISVKKNADSIVEAISAEDIGKLPDSSIAESIARLPGLAAQRARGDGRAREVSIRGMAPDFSTTLLNGREQVSTGDSRGVEYDQYPSELVNAVTVYKTPDAGLVGQGLSGTVDIQTVRPLDYGRRAVAVNYRTQKSGIGSIAEGDGSRFSLSYIDQFADRTLGLALGFARLDETGPTTSRFDSWGGGTYDTAAGVGNNGCTVGTGGCVNVPYNGFGDFADQTTQTRDGAVAVLQYRPSKAFSSTLDLFYSKFDQIKATKGIQAPLNDSWAGGDYDRPGSLSNVTLSGNNVTAGTFDNVRAIIRNDSESTFDKMTSLGWNNKLKFGDAWSLNADVAHSKIDRTGGILETTAGTAQSTLGTAQLDSFAFTTANGPRFTPGLDYTNRSIIKLTDVQGWGGGINSPQAGYSKLPTVNDEANSLRFSLRRDLQGNPWIVGVEAGLNYTDREKTRSFVEGRLVIAGDTTGLGSADMPGAGSLDINGIAIPTFDPNSALGSIYNVVSKLHPDIYNKDWTVNETVTTAFVKADVDRELFGLPVRGNFGVQLVNAKQSSLAFNVDRGTCANDQNCPATNYSDGTSYTDVLPSMNLGFDLGNDQRLRFALARVMARPNINDMRASLGFGVDQGLGVLKGDAGNPRLEPFRANAVDVAYEKYFGTKAYFGAAAFYKDLSTYIVKQDVTVDFTPFISPSTPLPPGGRVLGLLNQPVNGSGGNIQGVELTASVPFNLFTKALDGFGVQASYSHTSSSISLPASAFAVDGVATDNIPLPGLSRDVANLAVYFEKWGFSARVAARHRSNFVGEVADFAGDRRLTYVKAETITDLQLGYELQSGPAKGLSILFQANNVTDTPYIRYRDTPDNEIERKKFGKTYLLGLNYKL